MKPAPRFTLNQDDVNKWAKNLLIFSAPLLIVFLTQLQAGVPLDKAVYTLYGALINALIDILRKFTDGEMKK